MYSKLQDVLADDRASLALRRLYNVTRLEAMNASEDLVRSSSDLLQKSRVEFGDRFVELEALYVEYEKWEDANNKQLMAWQVRCHACKFGGDKLAVEDVDAWCEKYSVEDRSYPDPCPGFVASDEQT